MGNDRVAQLRRAAYLKVRTELKYPADETLGIAHRDGERGPATRAGGTGAAGATGDKPGDLRRGKHLRGLRRLVRGRRDDVIDADLVLGRSERSGLADGLYRSRDPVEPERPPSVAVVVTADEVPAPCAVDQAYGSTVRREGARPGGV